MIHKLVNSAEKGNLCSKLGIQKNDNAARYINDFTISDHPSGDEKSWKVIIHIQYDIETFGCMKNFISHTNFTRQSLCNAKSDEKNTFSVLTARPGNRFIWYRICIWNKFSISLPQKRILSKDLFANAFCYLFGLMWMWVSFWSVNWL